MMKEFTPNASGRRPVAPVGAVTGIGSLPFTCAKSAILSVAEFSPELPFWPQLPQMSERENIIGQGLGALSDLIEPRSEGYGYQVKDGRIDSAVALLHRSRPGGTIPGSLYAKAALFV